MTAPRVVLHYENPGDPPVIYADPGVTVFTICEFTPQDRTFMVAPRAIPGGMIDSNPGFTGDGSDAEKRLSAFIRGDDA
jgi:hypothetical protein